MDDIEILRRKCWRMRGEIALLRLQIIGLKAQTAFYKTLAAVLRTIP